MDVGDSAGGSRQLARLIDEYGDVVAADLMEYYKVDLRDIYRPEANLTPRYLFVLLKGLPVGSRFNSEKRGGQQFQGWDESRYMQASLINAVRALQYTYVQAHSKKKIQQPDLFPVPDRKQTTQSQISKPGSFANVAAQMILAARKKREAWQQEPKSDGLQFESSRTRADSDVNWIDS